MKFIMYSLHNLLLLLSVPSVSSYSCRCDGSTTCCPGQSRGGFGSWPPCSSCASGKYQNTCTNRAKSCSACPAGLYVRSDGQNCIYCSGGTYNSQNGQVPAVCGNCASGQYAQTVTGPCATCNPPFVYIPANSGTPPSYHCSACAPGQAMKTGGTTCSQCSLGQYQDESNSPTWGVGYNQFNCKLCEPGTYGSEDGAKSKNNCKSCTAGTYSKEAGAQLSTSCKSCPTGWTNTVAASISCTKTSVDPGCSQGQYSTEAGTVIAAQCRPCPAGLYSGNIDQVHSVS